MAVEVVDGIEIQANISTDGGMMLVRDEGWKEVKLVVVSAVRPKTASERSAHPDGRRYAPWEPQMMLERHSYQAALCSADSMERYQYLEGCRRGIPSCGKVSAVSDAAEWIERITYTNFPEATQIVDWFHAAERLWAVGKACFPDQETRKGWVQARLDDLWLGQVDKVTTTLQALDLTQQAKDEEVLQDPRLLRPAKRPNALSPVPSGRLPNWQRNRRKRCEYHRASSPQTARSRLDADQRPGNARRP